jgi:hypothetical protein
MLTIRRFEASEWTRFDCAIASAEHIVPHEARARELHSEVLHKPKNAEGVTFVKETATLKRAQAN